MLPQLQIQHKQRLQVQTSAIPLKQLSKHLSSCTDNSCLDALRLLQAGGTAAELMEQAMTKCPCFDPQSNRWSCSRCGNFVADDGLHLHICTSAPAFLNAAMVNLGMAETGARPWLKRCRFCKQALRADPGSVHTCSAAVFSHSLFDLSCSRTLSRSSSKIADSEAGGLHAQQQQQVGVQEQERAAKLQTEFIGHVASVFVCPRCAGDAHGSNTRPVSDTAGGHAHLLPSCVAGGDEVGGLLFFNGMVASSSLGPTAGRGLYTVSRISSKEPPAFLLNARMPRQTSGFVLPYTTATTSSNTNSTNSTSSTSSDNSIAVLDQQHKQQQELQIKPYGFIRSLGGIGSSSNSNGAALFQLHAQAGISPEQGGSTQQQQHHHHHSQHLQQQQQQQPVSTMTNTLLSAGVACWANQAHGHYANMCKHTFKQQLQQHSAWGGDTPQSQQQQQQLATFLVVKGAVAAGRELLVDYELQPCAVADPPSQLDCACPMPLLHKFCWSPESADTAAAAAAAAAGGPRAGVSAMPALPLPAVSHAAAGAGAGGAAVQAHAGSAGLLALAPEVVVLAEVEQSSSGGRLRKQGKPQRSRFE